MVLVDMEDIELYYLKIDPLTSIAATANSSCLNVPEPGPSTWSSYGGYSIRFPDSGAVQTGCFVPSIFPGSSDGLEAILDLPV